MTANPWVRRLPLLALAGAVLLPLVLGLAAPGWLATNVLDPWKAQAEPAPGLRTGYTTASLLFWAIEGALLGTAVFHLVFVRWRVEPDAGFFAALTPLLVFGPLFHALLVAGAIPRGTPFAYAAAEPPVYLTTALLGLVGIAAARLLRRDPNEGLALVGMLAVAPLVAKAVDLSTGASLARAAGLVIIALAAAALVATLARRILPDLALAAVFAVVAAHALDGATTWLSLRDPFHWGFEGFRESNPIAQRLVETSNGWPYFAVKLALPVVLLAALRKEDREHPARDAHELESERRLRALLLFIVFVLGYGPGTSNLMQVVLG